MLPNSAVLMLTFAFYPFILVNVFPLPVSPVCFPVSYVCIPVCILVHTVSLSLSLDPGSLVNRTIWISECTMSVSLTIGIFTSISIWKNHLYHEIYYYVTLNDRFLMIVGSSRSVPREDGIL